jgi:TnpA family transposase
VIRLVGSLKLGHLGRRIHHGERGEIRSPLQQGQEEQLGSLGLALNAIVHSIYMQEAIRHVRQEGMDVHNDDIAHLSPLIWRHFNFLGPPALSGR